MEIARRIDGNLRIDVNRRIDGNSLENRWK